MGEDGEGEALSRVGDKGEAATTTREPKVRDRFFPPLALLVLLTAVASALLLWWRTQAHLGAGSLTPVQAWNTWGWPLLLLLGLGLLAAFLLARQLGRGIEGPLRKVQAQAEALARGQLSSSGVAADGSAPPRGIAPLRRLAETLEQARAGMAQRQAEVEQAAVGLEDLNQDLQELDRAKSHMLAQVSRELREPVIAIGGYVESMREGRLGLLSESQRQSLEGMEQHLQHLQRMLEQLLTFSRVESSRLQVEPRPFSLEPVVREVVDAFKASQGEALGLQLTVVPDLPKVVGDPARIAEVLEHLLSNAIKFSPEGGRIDLTVQLIQDGVAIQVTDEGVGIPEGELDHIFQRFFRGTGQEQAGMGLGLARVREILDRHGCEVHVDSRPGMGSTFGFALKAAEESLPAKETVVASVVLVDGDGGFVRPAMAHLSRHGFAVETAATIQRGYSLVRRLQPDVVLLDRLLADGDGFDLLARLRRDETTRGIPIILVTALEERDLGLGLGAADYLEKPITGPELEAAVLRCLGREGEAQLPSIDS